MGIDMYIFCLLVLGVLGWPIWWVIMWCRALMGTWEEPLPPPDRSTLRRPEVDPEWEAEYGHFRHEEEP